VTEERNKNEGIETQHGFFPLSPIMLLPGLSYALQPMIKYHLEFEYTKGTIQIDISTH
jgi:hypothetical protein